MKIPEFNIGSTVWWASTESVQKFIQCSDCYGKKYVKVELADEAATILTIPCEGCKRGYVAPSGVIETWEAVVSVKEAIITGVDVSGEEVEYRSSISSTASYLLKESDIFGSRAEAEVRAAVLAAERTEAEAARHRDKAKPTKSWAWHVTYHRGCLKRAKRDVEYHTSQLEYARTLAKEIKP